MRLGILQRYVIGQLLRAFLLALLTITVIFVLLIVMAEATRQGLDPRDILRVMPLIVPGTLPYTVPVSLLFAVSVVFGRMAGDNEVVAVKTAGLSAMFVVWPALALGLFLSAGLAFASGELIPRAYHQFKLILFRDLEDSFYTQLKKERVIDLEKWPVFIMVRDVQDRTMIGATFKWRVPGRPQEFDGTVQAERARIRFDTARHMAFIELEDFESDGGGKNPFVVATDGKQYLQYKIPDRDVLKMEKKIQEMTNADLKLEQLRVLSLMRHERKRQAVTSALRIASGRISPVVVEGLPHWRIEGVDWLAAREAFVQYKYWQLKYHEYDTERQLRVALAFGPLFFVYLGAPVGILFARRDYLSAFMTCFLPIMGLYYPLILLGTNLGKEGAVASSIVWLGNGLLAVLAGFFAIPPVRKH